MVKIWFKKYDPIWKKRPSKCKKKRKKTLQKSLLSLRLRSFLQVWWYKMVIIVKHTPYTHQREWDKSQMCKTRKFFETPWASSEDIIYSRSQKNRKIKRSARRNEMKYRFVENAKRKKNRWIQRECSVQWFFFFSSQLRMLVCMHYVGEMTNKKK